MSFAQSPVNERHCVLKIVRFSDGLAENMIVLSHGLEGVQTHYTHRTVICGGDECALCFQGRPTRFLGFVAVSWKVGKGLLRLTSGPATQLMGMRPRPGLWISGLQKNRRSPIKLRKEGFVDVKPSDAYSQLELLNTIAHLFGVGAVDFNESYEFNVDRLRVLACSQTRSEILPFEGGR